MKYNPATGEIEGTPDEIRSFLNPTREVAKHPNGLQTLTSTARLTWDIVKEFEGEFSLSYVAEMFDLTPGAASQRMKTLIEAGLVNRIRNGVFEVA